MVRTRHSGETDGAHYADIDRVSGVRKRRGASRNVDVNGYDSDEFQSVPYQGSSRRSRRRVVETEDDDTPPRSSGRPRYRRRAVSPDDYASDSAATRSNHKTRRSARLKNISEAESEESCDSLPRPSRRKFEPRSAAIRRSQQRSESAAGDFDGVRRSGRRRKNIYDTYNQNVIENHMSFLTAAALAPDEEDDHDQPRRVSKRRKMHHDNEEMEEEEPMHEEEKEEKESLDMYTRVKRERKRVKRDMYGMPINTEGEDTKSEASDETTEAEDETEDDTETEEEDTNGKSYNLREHKPRTNLYEAPAIEPQGRRRRNAEMFRDTTPPPRRSKRLPVPKTYHSPARRKAGGRKRKRKNLMTPQKAEAAARRHLVLSSLMKGRRAAFHGSDSTSSSDSSAGGDAEDDERRFERRKAKSMTKSRSRCLPMNFDPSDVASGAVRDRQKIGASLADIDPMNIDRSVTFDSVGGLGKHLLKLKEMIVFPLLYPEVFERFKIQPPRGCLFYGPPGTGKTLVARALANECSSGEKKVAFFMRKGADCLSKWVGESERQLRLLFDQAYQTRPSIIFFDEIDGLAPVRSSRQDQIHSSIVSTLLALMDGLDSRGEVVVIGATNRIDSIDPALRRPGRFDREFFFPLPPLSARKQILTIHTKAWEPPVSSTFLEELAEKTVGYCGADLKSLCTEAALHALRRRYPQIYETNEKLKLDVTSINLIAKDFHRATQGIVPAAQRAVTAPARALLPAIRPLLHSTLANTVKVLNKIFPFPTPAGATGTDNIPSTSKESQSHINLELYSDSDEEGESIHDLPDQKKGPTSFLNFTTHAYHRPATHRPRLLLAGEEGQGQTSHLAPAVLHTMEGLPVHTLDLPALYAVTATAPEESCAQIFREAKRTSPSVIYMPHIVEWWCALGDACRSTFLTLLDDVEPNAPVLILASAETQFNQLPNQIANLFNVSSGEVVVMQNPTDGERKAYFQDLLLNQATKPPPTKKNAARRVLEELPIAPPPEPRKLTDTEKTRLYKQEEATLRELRLFLRDTLNKLGKDRKFNLFAKPVDEEEVPDYFMIIAKPMDLSTMMSKIDLHQYQTVQDFLDDIDLICRNALEYNPDTDAQGRAIRHRACALKDTCQAIITTELDLEFERLCEEIKKSRIERGENPKKDVPSYYFTKPLTDRTKKSLGGDIPGIVTSQSSQDVNSHESKQEALTAPQSNDDFVEIEGKTYFKYYKRVSIKRKSAVATSKSPWCKPSRRLSRRILYYVDEKGYEFPASDLQKESDKEEDETREEESQTTTAQEQEDNTDIVQINGKQYRKVYKRMRVKRKSSTVSKSPWCRPSKKVFRQVLFYVDEQGKEIMASEMMGEDNSDEDEEGAKDCAQEDPDEISLPTNTPLSVNVNINVPRRTRSNSPHGSRASMSPSNRSTRSQSAGSSRGKSGERRTSRLSTPSPKGSVPSPKAKSKEKELTPNRLNGMSPGRSNMKKRLAEAEAMDTIVEVPSNTSLASASSPDCSCPKNEKQAAAPPSSPGKMRVARSVNPSTQTAIAILNAEQPDFIINKDGLKSVLSRVVQLTRGFNIEKLQRLYSVLSQTIYHHRREYNKTQMLTELQQQVEKFQ